MMMRFVFPVLALVSCPAVNAFGPHGDSLPPLANGKAANSFEQMWSNWDPSVEPLNTEVLQEWEEDGVAFKVVRFHVGVFKGADAKVAAIYGFPLAQAKSGQRIPGLVQIHGGGQYADYKACLTNAKRGYATVSIAWAGRISAPGYRVSPGEVQLYWDEKKDDPRYLLTTDWGAVDGYHAPSRNSGNQFPSAMPAKWTLDQIESPRNSGWFLCAMAARRALTFLEHQSEVDADRLGVYGHSMGGKLTVLTAVDDRVKAAAPSCGGISDRYNDSPVFRSTLGDDVSLKQLSCPIIFLSPANDFHGRIGDLPKAIAEIQSEDFRVTCSPHHNHQDTAPFEVATQLWFDQHLKAKFQFPKTPHTNLILKTDKHTPVFKVTPDTSRPVQRVDVFYTQSGKQDEQQKDMVQTKTRFWHNTKAVPSDGKWRAELPLTSIGKPLWVYANVSYELDDPVVGAGYYYRVYSADSFNVSSVLTTVASQALQDAKVVAIRTPSLLIEDFQGDWKQEWFSYRPEEWSQTTNKISDAAWAAPQDAVLSIDVRAEQPNRLVIMLDSFGSEVSFSGGSDWTTVSLGISDFKNLAGESPAAWSDVRQLKLTHAEHLKPGRGSKLERRMIGGHWKGAPPEFRNLRWKPVQ